MPYSAGGGYDAYSRLLEPFYEAELGAEIVVTNLPGAGGIVGSKTISSATADGRTLGIINASGLLVANLSGTTTAPDPTEAFTTLGRIAGNQHVWATAATSPLATIDDVFARAQEGPLVFAVTDVGGTPFVSAAIGAALLGIQPEFVAGYPGSREQTMSLIRGEADLASFQFESVADRIEAGDVRPILQISDASLAPGLESVPLLGGPQGVAAERAAALGSNSARAEAQAQGLIGITSAGRLIVGPKGIDPATATCLADAFAAVMASPRFQEAAAAAQRTLDFAPAEQAEAAIRDVAREATGFIPIVQQSSRGVRS